MLYLEIKRHDHACRLGEARIGERKIKTPALLAIANKNAFFRADAYLIKDYFYNEKREIREKPEIIKYSLENILRNGKNAVKQDKAGILPSINFGYDANKSIAELGLRETKKLISELDNESHDFFGVEIPCSANDDINRNFIAAFKQRMLIEITNTEKLQKNYRKLAELIIFARKELSPNSIIYFSGAKQNMLTILSYSGVDFFDNYYALKSAWNGIYLTESREFKTIELKELPCSCIVCRKVEEEGREIKMISYRELAEHNFNVMLKIVKEIREHARKGMLREFVEEKANACAEAKGMLRILDSEKVFLEKYADMAPFKI